MPVKTEQLVLDLRSYLDAICNRPGANVVNPYDCLAQDFKDSEGICPKSVYVWCEFIHFFVYKWKLVEEIGLIEQTQNLSRIFEDILSYDERIKNLFLKYSYANEMNQKVCMVLHNTISKVHGFDIHAHEKSYFGY